MTMPYVYDKPEADKLANAKEQGQEQFDSIREMVEALQAANAKQEAEGYSLDSCEAHEDAERAIHEDALSVDVRGGWHVPGVCQEPSNQYGDGKAVEYRILLCTGGPAVQIVGDLSEHGEPVTAVMQVQDWFLPWTDFHPDNVLHSEYMEILLAYARCFYFGE